MLVALVLGALFNAPAMKKTALELPFGGERSFRLALVDPLAAVSHWLFLDRPAKLTAVALGKPDPGPGRDVGGRGRHPDADAEQERQAGKDGKPRKPPEDKPLPKPFKGHPMHLYIAGDSMMGLPGMALVNLSNKTKLIKPHARLPHLDRPGAARLLQLAGAAPVAGQGVRPRRRGRDVRRQRQPAAPDGLGQRLPVRQRRLEEGVPQARRGRHRPHLPGRRAAHLLDRPAGHAVGRRSTARSS